MDKKIFFGIFLAGLLSIGIGIGVVFMEVSSFEYGGEKVIDEDLTKEVYIMEIKEDSQSSIFVQLHNMTKEQVTVKQDRKIDPTKVIFEISYCEDFANPYINLLYVENEGQSAFKAGYEGKRVNNVAALGYFKNEILSSLKGKKYYTYKSEARLTIKASPETAAMIKLQ